jgi:hypothetical protein
MNKLVIAIGKISLRDDRPAWKRQSISRLSPEGVERVAVAQLADVDLWHGVFRDGCTNQMYKF